MKEMETTNQKYSSEFSTSPQPLKKMIPQLLLSVSLFSFLLSLVNSNSTTATPKFNHYFSANSFDLLSHALNKNCIFLICNGLLVFLAKTSGFVGPPSGHDLNELLQKRIGDSLDQKYHVLEDETKEEEEEEKGKSSSSTNNESPKEVSILIEESDQEERGGDSSDHLEKDDDENQSESRSCWLFDDEEQLYEQEEEEDIDAEEEEEEDGGGEDMNTEELNQKFEDFIRRMKEEIIINEARKKVVMVN